MQNGKVTTTGRVVVSADGKSRTVIVSGTDTKGKKFKSVAVYDNPSTAATRAILRATCRVARHFGKIGLICLAMNSAVTSRTIL